MGKGSDPRPFSISKRDFDAKWANINWGHKMPSSEYEKSTHKTICSICKKPVQFSPTRPCRDHVRCYQDRRRIKDSVTRRTKSV